MRVGEKEISEQAEIVRRYADLFSREQLDALREAEEARERRRARAALPAAQDLRGRPRLGRSSPSARTSSRTACSPTRVTFKGEEMPLRNAQAQLAVLPGVRRPRGARRDPGRGERRVQRRPARAAARRARSSRPSSRASPTPVERNEEEKGISLRELSRALQAASDDSTRELRGAARALVRAAARRRPPRGPVELPHRLHAPALAARVDVHEGPRDRDLPRRRSTALGFDLARAAEHQARPRRPAAEVAARVRDRERPAEGRAPDHARAGRPARLPGVPARGRARAALRRLRPEPAVHLPPHLARPRADRDLLVHRRGDLARARVARAATSASRPSRRARTPRRRRSSRRCSSAATRRSSASSSTSGRASPTTAATPTVYEELLTEATGIRYRSDAYLSDMDAGFYSADYLRAWIRSAQLRDHLIREVGDDWWRNPSTGELLRELFREGTKPTSEEIAGAARLRPARHEAAAARDRRVALPGAGARGQRPPRPKRSREVLRTSIEIGAVVVLAIVVLALIGVVLHSGRGENKPPARHGHRQPDARTSRRSTRRSRRAPRRGSSSTRPARSSSTIRRRPGTAARGSFPRSRRRCRACPRTGSPTRSRSVPAGGSATARR